MADEKSVVEIGSAQRGGDWPKPGEEGFVHPDGTQQSERQRQENAWAAADRKAAGSEIHGAPAQGGVAPGIPAIEPSDLAASQAEHSEWVHAAHEALAEEVVTEAEEPKAEGRHEAAAVTPPPSRSAKASE